MSSAGVHSYEDEGALHSFERVLELDQSDAEGWWGKGAALGGLGRLDESLAAFDKSLQLKPNSGYPHWGKASALALLDRLPEAVPLFERAVELDP